MLAEALERMPHTGPMRLITGIDQADDTSIVCHADGHTADSYPLRLGGVLYSAALVELGAQAAAAHASLFGLGHAHMGLVLTISDVTLSVERIENPDRLVITGTRIELLAMAASYRFDVRQAGAAIASGSVLLSMERVNT
ncbi:MAG: hypothetical protein AB8B85_17530 [Paracoccaceae bacterium]